MEDRVSVLFVRTSGSGIITTFYAVDKRLVTGYVLWKNSCLETDISP